MLHKVYQILHFLSGAFVEADFCRHPSIDDACIPENSANENETSHGVQPSESGEKS